MGLHNVEDVVIGGKVQRPYSNVRDETAQLSDIYE